MPLIDAQPDAVALTYAKSLFDAALASGGQETVESVSAELDEVINIARADAKFGEFLSSRIISTADRQASLERIFRGKASDLVTNLLLVLNANGRLAAIIGVSAAYDRLVQNAFGRIEVDVHTAAPLGPGELDALRGRLRDILRREPVLHVYTDESLIGGIRLQIGDQLIDGSVATQLRKVKDQLINQGTANVRAAVGRMFSIDPHSNGH